MEDKIDQTEEELRNQLLLQIRFLIKSCLDFDKGDHQEAIRMSAILRTLLKDGKNSVSLLSQTEKPALFNSYFYKPEPPPIKPGQKAITIQRNFITCILNGNPNHDFAPNLANEVPINKIPFNQWWEQVICKDFNENEFTRKMLILSCSETDGGAHVDPKINTHYYNITRNNSQQFIKGKIPNNNKISDPSSSNNFTPLKNSVWCSIRQIAHETIETLGFDMGYDPKTYYNQFNGFKLFSQVLHYIPR